MPVLCLTFKLLMVLLTANYIQITFPFNYLIESQIVILCSHLEKKQMYVLSRTTLACCSVFMYNRRQACQWDMIVDLLLHANGFVNTAGDVSNPV